MDWTRYFKLGIVLATLSCTTSGRLAPVVAANSPSVSAPVPGAGLTPRATWDAYARGDAVRARDLVEERAYASFVSGVPPGSPFAQMANGHVESERILGNVAQVIFSLPLDARYSEDKRTVWRTWLPFRRTGERWNLTDDRRPVYDALTKEWTVEQVGKLRYHSSRPLHGIYREQAASFRSRVDELCTRMGVSLSEPVEYYLADSEEEGELLGVTISSGGGQASHHAISAYKTAEHSHEFMHVLSNESGQYAGAFIEEGLATAIGGLPRLETRRRCGEAVSLLDRGYERWLDSSAFGEASLRGEPVYEVAAQVMLYWLEKFGIARVKALKQTPALEAGALESRIAASLEDPSATNEAVRGRVQKLCSTLRGP